MTPSLRPHLLAALALLATAAPAAAQWQYPAYNDDVAYPRLEKLPTMLPFAGTRPAWIGSRPIWYVPVGTVLRFRHDRLILPNTSRYMVGIGECDPTMLNQFFTLEPSDQERTISSDTHWTILQIGGAWYRDIFGLRRDVYGLYRHQDRHRIYMLLQSDGGSYLELEITPGANVTPTVVQFERFFELVSLPPVQPIP
ncbi:MAG: hypothetical protein K1X71_10495 [Pirellulales bacterium]|nr:hypothetical protein [Pirellulales bacterium]